MIDDPSPQDLRELYYNYRRMLQVLVDRLESANDYKGDESGEWESKTTDLFWVDQAKILLYGRIPFGHARSTEPKPEPGPPIDMAKFLAGIEAWCGVKFPEHLKPSTEKS